MKKQYIYEKFVVLGRM